MRDGRRLNVAITRAKYTLIVLANVAVMEKGSVETRALIQDAKKRRLVHNEVTLRERLGIAEPAVVASKKKKNKGQADKSSLQKSAAANSANTSATAASVGQSRSRSKRSKGSASVGVVELAVSLQSLSVSDSAAQALTSKSGRLQSTVIVENLASASVVLPATTGRPATAPAAPALSSNGAKKANRNYSHRKQAAVTTSK